MATQVIVLNGGSSSVARGDRVTGMAASQAEPVHRGVAYELQVNTTRTGALDCARTIAARVR